ncbi:Rid family hydrolase [Burkholderia sp. FERM BP-3421]|uniref:Rid family hydrolase n=1 Tax=Burkholderia sp. FERM BP-3421 TaxID=1494466 RepID=UPI0030826BDF
MTEAGLGKEDTVHMKAFLTDALYFQSFNKVFKAFFAAHPPARVCYVAEMEDVTARLLESFNTAF